MSPNQECSKSKKPTMKLHSLQPISRPQEKTDPTRYGGIIPKIRASLLLASLGFAALPAGAATTFTEYFSFGDSLTDSGNVALAVAPPYPSGRYSDGPTWAEQLSTDYLGLGPHLPSVAGGNNHAWGGAWTDGGGLTPTIVQQVGGYLAGGGSFTSTSLVSIWGGANDFFGTATNPGGPVNPGIPVGNISATIDLLAGAGARHILVPNLPDFGRAPDLIGTPGSAGASAWVQGFNTLLANELDAREAALGISIYPVDFFTLSGLILDDLDGYNFETAEPVVPDFTIDPADTPWWDGVHPTSSTHGFFAQEAFNSIPEPSTGALAIFAFGIACTRRMRR